MEIAGEARAGETKFGKSAEESLQAPAGLNSVRAYPSAIFAHRGGIEQPPAANLRMTRPEGASKYFPPILLSADSDAPAKRLQLNRGWTRRFWASLRHF